MKSTEQLIEELKDVARQYIEFLLELSPEKETELIQKLGGVEFIAEYRRQNLTKFDTELNIFSRLLAESNSIQFENTSNF